MNIQGKITKKEVKEGDGDKGHWIMFLYTVNGVMYGTFNEDYSGYVEGTEVDIIFEQKGKYNNIKTMCLKGENKLSSFKQSEGNTDEIVDRQKLIVRQNALTNANYLMRTCYEKLVISGEEKPEDIVKRIATELEAWVFRDE